MTTVNAGEGQIQFLNESADFWRYDIGVNVIPADTINKRPVVTWTEWQDRPIPEELHNRWKDQRAFSNGMAIVPGKLWHSIEENKRALYLVFIDADKRIAIEEFCTRNGKTVSLRELSQKFLIEQHADNPDKAHIYFYSPIPFPQKTADSTLGLEVKGLGKHGIAFCFPSKHKDGMKYEIIGTNRPVILTIEQSRDLIQHIDQICIKHKLQYLEKDTSGSSYSYSPIVNNTLRNIIRTLSIDTSKKIPKGQRHVTLISVANSLLFNHLNKGKGETEKELKLFFEQVNYLLCEPEPLPDNELCSIWNSAVNFVSRIRENEKVKGKEKALDGESNNDTVKEENENPKKSYYVQKYHESESLAESLIISGKPYFAVARPKPDNPSEIQITFEESITLADETSELRPFELMSYMNKPYLFRSNNELESYLELARKENLDSLYIKVKHIWKKYIDGDDFHISICAADTVFTYFQDKIGLTHYLFFIGNNTSGKSNNLHVLHQLAYRNVTSTDMTSANIYQVLGSLDEGQATICEDEADNIDENQEKMRIYKNGYTVGFPVLRTDTTYGRKQFKFNTFCLKAYAAERLPDSLKAKGFNQRIIEIPCLYGFPQYDISEVVNPAGEEGYQNLLDELNEVRNLLFAYRLLHFNDKIPNIELNIQNREKQLFKPVLRIFQNTETLRELLPVISKYVSQKRENNANTLYAFLYRTITDLIKAKDTAELESGLIWDTVIELLPGELISNKKLSYESPEFGTISQKGIIEILMQVFGASPSHNRREKRKLVFDMSKLERLGKVYDLSIEVKVGKSVAGVTDVTDIGLDRHLSERSSGIEMQEITNENDNS
jgi:hypothetical protein